MYTFLHAEMLSIVRLHANISILVQQNSLKPRFTSSMYISLYLVGLDPETMKKFESLTIIPKSQLEILEPVGKGKDFSFAFNLSQIFMEFKIEF